MTYFNLLLNEATKHQNKLEVDWSKLISFVVHCTCTCTNEKESEWKTFKFFLRVHAFGRRTLETWSVNLACPNYQEGWSGYLSFGLEPLWSQRLCLHQCHNMCHMLRVYMQVFNLALILGNKHCKATRPLLLYLTTNGRQIIVNYWSRQTTDVLWWMYYPW